MKILASDFDGTLFYKGTISEQDKVAIARFREAGNKFGIVTGRDIDNGLIISRGNFYRPDFTICCTGAIIMDESGKIVFQKKGKVGSFFYDLIKKAMSLSATLFMISDGFLKYNVDVWGVNPIDISLIKEFTQANTWFTREEDAKEFADFVNSKFGYLVCAHQNGLGVDLPPPETSKVTGIKEYANQFENAKVYTVGDNVNDIEMIEAFNGFAVENATEKVKAAARRHCGRIADLIDVIMKE